MVEVRELQGLLVTILTRKPKKRKQSRVKARSGDIKAAVVQVLELSAKPLGLRDVHLAVEEILDQEVPYSTIKDCIHKHSRGDAPPFRRVRHGYYDADPISQGLALQRQRHPGNP